jgi:hypothetical protein
LYRRTRRLVRGSWVYIIIAGSYYPYKLTQSEVHRIENETGKRAENLTEDEMNQVLQRNNIEERELTEEEHQYIDQS